MGLEPFVVHSKMLIRKHMTKEIAIEGEEMAFASRLEGWSGKFEVVSVDEAEGIESVITYVEDRVMRSSDAVEIALISIAVAVASREATLAGRART